ncbi:MAG: hypothetical protein Kow0062_13080 [Acidobacteriota bacterium]
MPPGIRTVLERLALWPDGREFFDRGPLECVAVVFGVRPDLIEQARAFLADESGSAAFEELRRSLGTARARPPEPVRRSRGALPGSPEELIEHARAHPLGLRCLLDPPVETAAVLFGVTPFLVIEARRALHERGIDPEPVPEDR